MHIVKRRKRKKRSQFEEYFNEEVRNCTLSFSKWCHQRKLLCVIKSILTNNGSRSAISETIALEALGTTADRAVVDNPTVCVGTAGSRTRIDAFLIDTRAIRGTVGADDTLWTTIGCRSDHIWHATTVGLPVHNGTKSVGSARMRTARIGRKRAKCRFFHYGVRNCSYKFKQVINIHVHIYKVSSWSVLLGLIQFVSGSPVDPAGHPHIGLWLTTRHSAF